MKKPILPHDPRQQLLTREDAVQEIRRLRADMKREKNETTKERSTASQKTSATRPVRGEWCVVSGDG